MRVETVAKLVTLVIFVAVMALIGWALDWTIDRLPNWIVYPAALAMAAFFAVYIPLELLRDWRRKKAARRLASSASQQELHQSLAPRREGGSGGPRPSR